MKPCTHSPSATTPWWRVLVHAFLLLLGWEGCFVCFALLCMLCFALYALLCLFCYPCGVRLHCFGPYWAPTYEFASFLLVSYWFPMHLSASRVEPLSLYCSSKGLSMQYWLVWYTNGRESSLTPPRLYVWFKTGMPFLVLVLYLFWGPPRPKDCLVAKYMHVSFPFSVFVGRCECNIMFWLSSGLSEVGVVIHLQAVLLPVRVAPPLKRACLSILVGGVRLVC